MEAIERIIDQILEKGTAEITELKNAELKQIDEAYAEQEEALLLQEKKLIEKNNEQSLKNFKQKQNRQQLEIKQSTLNQKQGYLEQLFLEAVKRMNNWNEVEFQAFAQQIIEQLTLIGKAELQLGAYSQGKLTNQWLIEHTPKDLDLQLQPNLIADVGGFIIAQNGIEYNFLFPSLVQEIKRAESFDIAERLFR
ncbi:hypothetical protein [Enterococcus termitis]|uniref:Uncharacterized protein n=1 Tax=Enterococcus termitis TaxID=332950 RepID=A0A1E5GST8_9ENTE|nr:hypothetical protein [Enterococcus termitis]OEG15758.1 hypothetical protein BCR25_18595 [Enterococcus termitis]OJG96641.1 hypothetical protein RV18_GL002007 [Enterococcus termitis]